MTDAVTIFREWVDVMSTLPSDAARGRLYHAVCKYALDGEEPTLTGPLRSAFELMRHGIDVSAKRRRAQEQGVRKRLQNRLQNSLQNDLQNVYKTETCKPFCKSSKDGKESTPPAPPLKEKGENTSPPTTGARMREGEGEPGMRYPETVEEVLAIAALPQCGARLTEDDARKYLVCRMSSDWTDAAGRRIAPVRIIWDLKKWEMGQNERRPAKGKSGVDYSDPATWGELEK